MPQVAIIDFIKQILITTLISSTPPTHPESSLSPTHYSHSLSLSLSHFLSNPSLHVSKSSPISLSLWRSLLFLTAIKKFPQKGLFPISRRAHSQNQTKPSPQNKKPLKGDTNQKPNQKVLRERERERERKAEHTFLEF